VSEIFDFSVARLMRQNETALDEIVKAAADIALVVDRSGTIQDAYFGDQIGEPEPWVGRNWASTVTDATGPKVDDLLREAERSGVSRFRQLNHTFSDGIELPVEYTTVRLSEDGTFLALGRNLQVLEDLQQQLVEAQQAMERDYWRLREVETRYRVLFQRSSEPVLVLHADSLEIQDLNPAAADLFEADRAELLGCPFPDLVGEENRGVLETYVEEIRERGQGAVEATLSLARTGVSCTVRGSLVRHEPDPVFLLHLRCDVEEEREGTGRVDVDLTALMDRAPDGFVVTDLKGHVLMANRSFLDMAQLGAEEEALGGSIGQWLGRPGADVAVLLSNLERHGVVRLFPTTVEGELDSEIEVELSAVSAPDAPVPAVAIILRDVGRRLGERSRGRRDLSRAVEDLTDQLGKVSLKDLVQDTVSLVERHFIDAALELTDDNRTAAAELLGLSRQSLYTKLRRYDVDGKDD